MDTFDKDVATKADFANMFQSTGWPSNGMLPESLMVDSIDAPLFGYREQVFNNLVLGLEFPPMVTPRIKPLAERAFQEVMDASDCPVWDDMAGIAGHNSLLNCCEEGDS